MAHPDLFLLAPVSLCVLDRDGTLLAANTELARLVGRSDAELRGARLDRVLGLDGDSRLREHLDRCFEDFERARVELWAQTVAGPLALEMISAPLVQPEGEVASCMSTLADVTPLRAALERARALDSASAALLSPLDEEGTLTTAARLPLPHLADVAFIDTGRADGRFTRWTHDGTATIDSLEGTPQGHAMATRRTFACARCPAATIASALAGSGIGAAGEGSLLVVPLVAGDRVLGAMTCLFTRGRRHASEDVASAEALAARVATAIDHVQRYRAVRRAQRRRERALEHATHDLRGALQRLRLACEQMAVPAARAGTTAQAVDRGVGAMDRLTRDLLALSSRPAPIGCEATDLLLEAIDLLRPRVDEKHISLVASARRGAEMRCDRELVVQALLNVLGDAIDRTPARGAIRVDVASDGAAVFAVRAGDGLPAPDGSDVALARAILEAHGGRLAIERAEHGSVVKLTLPGHAKA